MTSFTELIKDKFIVPIYHFLDGHLNENFGSHTSNIYKFLRFYSKKHDNNDIEKKILLHNNDIINITDNHIVFNFKDTTIDFNIANDYEVNNNIEDIKNIINEDTYNIFDIRNDSHCTSIVFFTRNNNFYMLSINSGNGINLHDKKNELYSPFFGKMIVENYNSTDDKYIESISKMCAILSIKYLYNCLKKPDITKHEEIIKIHPNYHRLSFIRTIILFIKKCFGENNIYYEKLFYFSYFKFNSRTDTESVKMEFTTLDSLKGNYDGNVINFQFIMHDKRKYYELFYLLIKSVFLEGIYLKDLNSNLINFNISVQKFKSINVHNDVIKKGIFHFIDNDLFIHDQESGSCTWFSKYWPILIYYIINNDIDAYIKFINTINKLCYDMIQYMFNTDTYGQIITRCCNFEEYPVNLYLGLAKKLVDYKIIDKNIFYNFQDYIYKIFANKQYFDNNLIDDKNIDIFNKLENYITIDNNFKLIYQDAGNTLRIKNIQEFKVNMINYISEFRIILNKYNTQKNIKELTSKIFVYFSEILKDNTNNYNELIMILLWELYKTLKINNTSLFTDQNINYQDVMSEVTKIKEIYSDQLWENKYEVSNIKPDVDKKMNIIIIKFNDLTEKKNNVSLNFTIDYFNYLTYINEIYKEYSILDGTGINISNTYTSFYDDTKEFINICYFYEKFRLVFNFIKTFNGMFYSSHDENYILVNKNMIKNIISMFTVEGFNSDTIDKELKSYWGYSEIIYKEAYASLYGNSNGVEIFNFYSVDIDKYVSYVKYILTYPNLMYEYLDKYEKNKKKNLGDIEYINFISYHIHYIYERAELRDNLLSYFCNKFYLGDTNRENGDIILGTIGILLNMHSYSANLIFQINYVAIKKEYVLEKLNEIKKNKTNEEFINFIIKNKDTILEKYTNVTLIKKHIGDNIVENNNLIKINNKKYHPLKNIIQLEILFNNNDKSLFLYEIDESIIHMLNEDYILSFHLKTQVNYSDIIRSIIPMSDITKIYFNNNEVIKFNDLNLPFKYVIPLCGINLIYKKQNTYHVTYFKNSLLSKLENGYLLGINSINDKIITLKINNNNLMYFERGNDKINNDIELVCENYGINEFNYIYSSMITKKNDNFEKSAYWIGDKLSTYYNKYHTFDKKIINVKEKDNMLLMGKNEQNNVINLDSKIDIYNNPIIQNTIIKGKALKNLIKKIQHCTVDEKYEKYKDTLGNLINNYDIIINNFTTLIYNKNLTLDTMLSDDYYTQLSEYLLSIKYKNICETLLNTKNENLCSTIKIFNEQLNSKKYRFHYYFEIFFELIFGFEITEEQYNRYVSIINLYNNSLIKTTKTYNNISKNYESKYIIGYSQSGGKIKYPLHHFMMGKGKSAVVTPLLMLYFSIIHKKEVYIIVPGHLINQTKYTLNTYIKIFNLNNIFILSDSDIKKKFLEGAFVKNNQNKIMLIDEFDTILDPLKSNFNLVTEKNIDVAKIFKIILHVVKLLNQKQKIENIDISTFDISTSIQLLIKKDIKSIFIQIEQNKLKENIHWGINYKTCYAIPYLNKDKPLIQSNFSSCVLTIFLTLYYYIIIKKYEMETTLYNYLCDNKYIYNVLDAKIISDHDTFEKLDNYIKSLNKSEKEELFDKIFGVIINSVKLASEQENTSFIDIINIDKIFKIGYSGTLNIDNIPIVGELLDDITEDTDELANIFYAINNSTLVEFDNIKDNNLKTLENLVDSFITFNNLEKYGALIDASGIFKNVDNQIVATKLHETLNRPVIYLDMNDNKLVINNNNINLYDETISYEKQPFLYYSQTHIIGIDINQNKYPNILGLCTVDDTIVYSTIAQAIFRLRKLNMGHKINFYFVDKKYTKYDVLFKMLKNNEEIEKINKHPSLLFQTIKSILRKQKPKSEKFSDNYKEKIKYYYLENDISEDTKTLLSDIIDYNKAKKYDFFKKELDNCDSLIKLIYNIDNISYQTQKEEEDEKEIESKIEKKIESVVYEKNIVKIENNNIYVTKEYNFKNFENEFESLSVKVNFYIYVMPDIISYFDGTLIHTDRLPSLMFIYLPDKKKLVIIRKDCFKYVYDKFPIFSLEMILLNLEKKYMVDENIINEIKKLDFIKFFQREDSTNIRKILNSSLETSIIYHIVTNLKEHTEMENKIYITNDDLHTLSDEMRKNQINTENRLSLCIDNIDNIHRYVHYLHILEFSPATSVSGGSIHKIIYKIKKYENKIKYYVN